MICRAVRPSRPFAGMLMTLAATWIGGCSSPLERQSADELLRQSVELAIDREIQSLPDPQQRLATVQPPSAVITELASRRQQLDELGPLPPHQHASMEVDAPLGADLTGSNQQTVSISLQWAIASTIKNNLTVQLARLQPAINEADLVAAEAAFDAVFFANAELINTDAPATVPVLNGIPLGTPFDSGERYRFETGVRKPLVTGGDISLSTDLTRSRNTSPGIDFDPDPAYFSAMRLGLNQPLLRGFGSDVNLALIRISRNAVRSSVQELRAELLAAAAETESAYWDLVFAWRELLIRQWLVDVGEQVRYVLQQRQAFDTRPAEYYDAVARVEQRKADVIRARRLVQGASDRLKVLLNDPELTVGGESLLSPVDLTVESQVSYSLADALTTAIERRPEIQQAALAIDDQTIRQRVADNGRLPILDLRAQVAWAGLEDDAGSAYDDLFEGDFIDYLVGLGFVQPIGNRGPEAEYRRARLERSASVIAFQRTVQDTVFDVKSALRNVVTNYELIGASRSFRVAQAENLRTLLVEEDTRARLTPEFLNLKFQRQETLAEARREEEAALSNYNKSLADLYRAMGVGLEMNQVELEIVDDVEP
jgi:outer membrane protein TolC